jgi:hypothetical protein
MAGVPGHAYKQQVRTLLGLRPSRGPGRRLQSGHRPARASRHDHPAGTSRQHRHGRALQDADDDSTTTSPRITKLRRRAECKIM